MQKQQAAPSLRAFTLTSEMARDKPRLLAALEVASAAMAKVCAHWEESRWDRRETKAQHGMCCPLAVGGGSWQRAGCPGPVPAQPRGAATAVGR